MWSRTNTEKKFYSLLAEYTEQLMVSQKITLRPKEHMIFCGSFLTLSCFSIMLQKLLLNNRNYFDGLYNH